MMECVFTQQASRALIYEMQTLTHMLLQSYCLYQAAAVRPVLKNKK